MEMSKSILLQKQVRDNSEDLQTEFLDLKNWEAEMKKSDAQIRNDREERILPPVRRKAKTCKESSKPASRKENAANSKRIKSCDYSAWEKFDVNKACSQLDKNETDDEGEEPLSKAELEKNHAEATRDKIAGNNHVKKAEWAKAVACYSAAFKKFPYDPVFVANRALCHLKMDNLHMAEADCTAAIEMDEFYVKAYHRRATARISLKRYGAAAEDIKKMLTLEPANKEAQAMLVRVNKLLQTSKPLILSSARAEVTEAKTKRGKMFELEKSESKSVILAEAVKTSPGEIIEEKTKKEESEGKKKFVEAAEIQTFSKLPEWLPEVPEDIGIVEVITKLPHQRSKKPWRTVTIEEIEFGPKSRPVESNEKPENSANDVKIKENPSCQLSELDNPEESVPEAPKTAVQFLLTWGKNKSTQFRYKYLKNIAPERIPTIFRDSMESNTFSEILQVLRLEFTKRNDPVLNYLKHLSDVKRFRTLTMFMNKNDREDVRSLFDYSRTLEDPSEETIKHLLAKYEI